MYAGGHVPVWLCVGRPSGVVYPIVCCRLSRREFVLARTPLQDNYDSASTALCELVVEFSIGRFGCLWAVYAAVALGPEEPVLARFQTVSAVGYRHAGDGVSHRSLRMSAGTGAFCWILDFGSDPGSGLDLGFGSDSDLGLGSGLEDPRRDALPGVKAMVTGPVPAAALSVPPRV